MCWLPTKEFCNGLHLILTSPFLENHMSVSPSDSIIKRILLERRFIHVHSDSLGPEIAIHACIAASKEVSVGCIAMPNR